MHTFLWKLPCELLAHAVIFTVLPVVERPCDGGPQSNDQVYPSGNFLGAFGQFLISLHKRLLVCE